jgi:hypothetical protein
VGYDSDWKGLGYCALPEQQRIQQRVLNNFTAKGQGRSMNFERESYEVQHSEVSSLRQNKRPGSRNLQLGTRSVFVRVTYAKRAVSTNPERIRVWKAQQYGSGYDCCDDTITFER